tara:strand:- start:131 stop:352 length:222 start_codon:yes stop_codon:yes gene_type:complete
MSRYKDYLLDCEGEYYREVHNILTEGWEYPAEFIAEVRERLQHPFLNDNDEEGWEHYEEQLTELYQEYMENLL